MYGAHALIPGGAVLENDDADVLFQVGLALGAVAVAILGLYERRAGQILGNAAMIVLLLLNLAGLGCSAWGWITDDRELEASLLPFAAGTILPSIVALLFLGIVRLLFGKPPP